MLLTAFLTHPPGNANVLILSVHTAERVARKGPRRRAVPSHDHSGVQASGERHSYSVVAVEIPGKTGRDRIANGAVVRLGIQWRLVFPFGGLEVSPLPFERSAT